MNEPTIYDVAEAAGVAASTVSRSFSNPGRVRESTRLRVLEHAERLGYRPNPHARALFLGETKTIAMVVSDITNPYYFSMIKGAELRTRSAGYTLVLVDAEESAHNERMQVERLSRGVDGFLLVASRLPDDQLSELADSRGIVLLNRQFPRVPSVVLDHAEGSRQIVRHLHSLGHRHLVYLAGPPTSWMARVRWASILDESTRLGVRSDRVGPFTPKVANGAVAADAGLATGATALVAHNDLLAIGVVRRLNARGLGVPEDLSVVGFDDIFAAELCTPGLTTLGGSHDAVGRIATELLLERLRPATVQDPPQLLVQSELVVRESTGPANVVTGPTV